MSKSKNNYIGITEPPKVMFRKVMQIRDELMYRYYELLTDLSLAEIAALKHKEPMEAQDGAGPADRGGFSFAGGRGRGRGSFRPRSASGPNRPIRKRLACLRARKLKKASV